MRLIYLTLIDENENYTYKTAVKTKFNLSFGSSGSCIYDENGNVLIQLSSCNFIESGPNNKISLSENVYGLTIDEINEETSLLIG